MNQLIKIKQELAKSEVNSSTRHLLNSIKEGNNLEIEKNLQLYRENGVIKYENLLSIPLADRLPGLVEKYGSKKVHGVLVVMLTTFCNSFNVIRPMTAEQIVECASEILNTSKEDFLSIEDLSIFFIGAKNGKYGKVYDRLDQQVIFEMLEVYREVRHRMYKDIQEVQESKYKIPGPQMRVSEDIKELKELFHKDNLEYYQKKQSETKP